MRQSVKFLAAVGLFIVATPFAVVAFFARFFFDALWAGREDWTDAALTWIESR